MTTTSSTTTEVERRATQASTARTRRAVRREIAREFDRSSTWYDGDAMTLADINDTGGFIVTRGDWYC